MAKQGFGRIVNMASVAADIAHGNQTVYSVSKSGIATMARNMAIDLVPFGIAVNAMAPGTIATEFAIGALTEGAKERRLQRIPMGRFGETGSIVAVDGGLTVGGVGDVPIDAAP
jgi:NAD(P)-dependent dehydrogenase (short-subunit alcohol dehydrogenase family)